MVCCVRLEVKGDNAEEGEDRFVLLFVGRDYTKIRIVIVSQMRHIDGECTF
jgi:hypothetical protein